MAKLSVSLLKNDFSARRQFPNIKFTATPISWRNNGGPDVATVKGEGDWDIDEAIGLLRAPIEIFAPNGECCWWGYVDSIRVVDGAIEYGIGMESVSNRVACKGAGNWRVMTTYWTSDEYGINDSMVMFGTKELYDTTDVGDQLVVQQYRDTLLQTYQWPKPIIRHNPTNKGRYFELSCKGWYNTLSWQYGEGVVVRYEPGHHSTLYHEWVGHSYRALAQKITLPYNCKIDGIGLNFGWAGGGFKNVRMLLMADGPTPGPFGTEFASAELALANIVETGGYRTDKYDPDATPPQTAGTSIWLVVDAQEIHPGGAYKVWCKAEQSGTALIHNGSSWVSPSSPFNLVYRLYLTVSTGDLIRDVIKTCGQFLTVGDMPTTGVEAPGRHTMTTGLSTVDAVLKIGTTNNRMLIIKVTRDRVVNCTEEIPGDASTATLVLKRDGRLYNRSGMELYPPYSDPCGQWCIVDGLIPSTMSALRSVDPSCFRIDRATYYAGNDMVTVEPRGVPSPYEVFSIKAG